MAGDAVNVIEISSSDDDDYDYTPLKRALTPPAKKISPVKTEKKENKLGDLDCFILDFDPFESINLTKKLVLEDSDDDADEVLVVSERGSVACRDYPHSRHLCANFPFNKTPHESHCQQGHPIALGLRRLPPSQSAQPFATLDLSRIMLW